MSNDKKIRYEIPKKTYWNPSKIYENTCFRSKKRFSFLHFWFGELKCLCSEAEVLTSLFSLPEAHCPPLPFFSFPLRVKRTAWGGFLAIFTKPLHCFWSARGGKHKNPSLFLVSKWATSLKRSFFFLVYQLPPPSTPTRFFFSIFSCNATKSPFLPPLPRSFFVR